MFSYPPFGAKEESGKTASLWTDYFNPLILTFFTLLLRFINLGKPSISLDEGGSVFFAQKTLREIIPSFQATHEVHPPLFFYLAHFWLKLGHSEFFLRSFSVWFSLLIVLTTYFIGKRLLDARTAFWGGLLLSFSSFDTFYSQEFRMYPLTGFFWVFSLFCLLCYLNNGKTLAWLGLTISTLLALYSHYLSLFLIPVQLIIWISGENRFIRLKGMILAYLAIFMGFLPQLKLFLSQTGAQDMTLRLTPDLRELLLEGAKITFGYHTQFTAHTYLLLGLFTVLPLIFFAAFTMKSQARIFLFSFLLVPLTLTFLITRTTNLKILELKYLYLLMPALTLIYGWALFKIRSQLIIGLFLGLFFSLNLFSWYNAEFNPLYRSQDWRLVGGIVSKYAGTSDLILIHPSMTSLPLRYYFYGKAHTFTLDEFSPARLAELIKPYHNIYLVTIPNHPLVRNLKLEDYLRSRLKVGNLLESKVIFPENIIRIVVFKKD